MLRPADCLQQWHCPPTTAPTSLRSPTLHSSTGKDQGMGLGVADKSAS